METKHWRKVQLFFFSLMILAWVIFGLIPKLNSPEGEGLPVLDQAVPFILEDAYQEAYDSNNQKVKLLAFFYTNCPDICPMTMMDFAKLQEELKEKQLFGSKVELIAITLDPKVDTSEVIASYAKKFKADQQGWKFLRGTPEQTKTIADFYHMKYKKTEGNFIAHNTTMFLIDQNNQIRGLYDMANAKNSVDTAQIMEAIERLTNK
ncbi:SCO family protein [Mesobacillus harenae]|uniref:SCO family protein n=1 Tax=Mesobacillus harenae TaxID=2213203 RepID=UPI00158072AB|nr:SCO family protein [Mesobacillus harenae]